MRRGTLALFAVCFVLIGMPVFWLFVGKFLFPGLILGGVVWALLRGLCAATPLESRPVSPEERQRRDRQRLDAWQARRRDSNRSR